MESHRVLHPGRIARLRDELADEVLPDLDLLDPIDLVLDELDYALRPPVHEGRTPTYGSFVAPATPPHTWAAPTTLTVTVREASERADDDTRKYADGRASFAVRTEAGVEGLIVFDRSAGSERDLVVLADVAGGVIVQRDRWKVVRAVGSFGVLRWDGLSWHHEPPVSTWLREATSGLDDETSAAFGRLLQFAVHDLGARGVGALLVFRPGEAAAVRFEERLSAPPPLRLDRPSDLAPLKQVLGQIDGATVFSADGTLTHLGVRIVPSLEAEVEVDPYRGTRHTSARRYSFDDPTAVVVVVSEDGPVTVWRNGLLVGRSEPDDD
ncbi:MAG: DNA integrity scanning protein DisA nucleotide-binding domain protein [Ilumatobacteraceae bacterium]|jgi:DNA integrity scanning protein DisA with diadenylate cyclase activity|nr:DNA integrity scanning protein DisA nucleotide-binding domain protein [Ilumatobacteraceae bacterium]